MPRKGFATATSPTSSLLPAGYLSTRGNQIVGPDGTPVRIDAIGWSGPDGDYTFTGLRERTYQDILDTVKADGFNAVRLPWSDANLTAKPPADWLQANPSLLGLNDLQIFQKIVAYAGSIGLKVIFDHHTNEGGYSGWGGQQSNGLWFDVGSGSDGTDGNGNTGTVDAAKFQQDWLTIAQTFAGNSTVIGFDLDNEPLVGSASATLPVNWGQGGPTDIQAMYHTIPGKA
jgi:endoglucanase